MIDLRVFLALCFVLMTACNGGSTCSSDGLGSVGLVPDLQVGVPVDVETFEDGAYEGPITYQIVDGTLPPGLTFEDTRLVGTPTEEVDVQLEVVVHPEDPTVCDAYGATIYISVRERECITAQACHARSFGHDSCASSSDCVSSVGLTPHCVQVLENEGTCLDANLDCRGDTESITYVDTEGFEFASCGLDFAVECTDPGFCNAL